MPGTRLSRTRELVLSGLLTALALIIPMLFRGTPLQIYIPPLSATLASHVPSMLAMFISPMTALIVGLGSTFGFLITTDPIIAARAFSHVLFGVAGAYLYRRGWQIWPVMLAVLPIHAVAEALAVYAFAWSGVPVAASGLWVGGITVAHHLADGFLTWAIVRSLAKAGVNLSPVSPTAPSAPSL